MHDSDKLGKEEVKQGNLFPVKSKMVKMNNEMWKAITSKQNLYFIRLTCTVSLNVFLG